MASLFRRFWLARGRGSALAESTGSGLDAAAPLDPVQQAAAQLRQAREARGLNLRQLAQQTRISTPVLEALERGWLDRLPEPAYLRTMLPLLERNLALEPGSLRVVLPEAQPSGMRRRGAADRPPLLSVELFTTWQGTALYGVLLLVLLYGLNREQRRLAAQGVLALAPLPPMAESARRALPRPGSDLLLQLHPDLRPLALAAQDRGLQLLHGSRSRSTHQAESGVLELSLTRAAQLQLQAAGGQRSAMQVGPGELVLPLAGPLQLSLQPPPSEPQQVRWNGEPLQPEAPGRYRWPRPLAAANSP